MKHMTFTGIDAKTDTNWIKDMGEKYCSPSGYSSVEFAILRSPKVGKSARYPTQDQIRRITNYVYPKQLAFHLCGAYARMVHDGEWLALQDIIDFSLVSRVQVNSTEADEKAIVQLQRFAAYIGRPVVMQWRGDTFPLVVGSVDLLQDKSGGTGQRPEFWSHPDDLCKKAGGQIGYAGGLSPENIKEQYPRMKNASRGIPFWTDCESGVRTDDWFDKDKAESMMAAIFEAKGWPTR